MQAESTSSCHSCPFPPEQLCAVCPLALDEQVAPQGLKPGQKEHWPLSESHMCDLAQKSVQFVTLSLNSEIECKTHGEEHAKSNGAQPGRKWESRSYERCRMDMCVEGIIR